MQSCRKPRVDTEKLNVVQSRAGDENGAIEKLLLYVLAFRHVKNNLRFETVLCAPGQISMATKVEAFLKFEQKGNLLTHGCDEKGQQKEDRWLGSIFDSNHTWASKSPILGFRGVAFNLSKIRE